MKSKLSKEQLDRVSEFLTDVAKLLLASSFIGFFIPSSSGQVSLSAFAGGTLLAFACFLAGIKLVPKNLKENS